jgi:hypothetical protein
LGPDLDGLMSALADRLTKGGAAAALKPAEITQVFWAFAKLRVRKEAMMSDLAERLPGPHL